MRITQAGQCAATFALLLVTVSPMAAGQAAAATQVIRQKTCLVRDANRHNYDGDSPQIPSTDGDQAELKARGYREVPCTLGLVNRIKFRVQVCKIAALNDPVISGRFEELYAVRPEVMCRSATAHVALP